MLELKNITKDYLAGENTVHALKGINLQFRRSELVSILGPSGCGKTTMLNIIGGLDRYTDGDLIINGRSTKDFKDRDWDAYRNHSIGFVFQSYNLIPHQTVLQNVELALTLSGVSKSERRERAKKALEDVGLGEQLHKRPSEMSGGQMQRVAIARALVLDPQFLLCDEATSALDPEITKGILALLQKINQELGITIIIVTHQMEVVKQVCRKVAFLSNGVVLAEGRPEKLFVHPDKPEIKTFLRDDSELLPKSGLNVQLFFSGEGGERPIVSEASRTLGIDISISWAKLEDFRKKVYGSLVVTIDENDWDKFKKFLDEKDVEWEVLK